jgi:uncharacterized SAM-binding protein YcdF (DUF218 family)
MILNKGSDRILHTVQLYRQGKVRKILISGGSGKLLGEAIPEAFELAEIFKLCGVPSSDLILENRSMNTRENAIFTKKLLGELKFNGRSLLITSAFHMKRAILCFKKAGLKTDAFSTDFYSDKTVYTPAALIFPSEKALSKWSILIHEFVGIIIYKISGYI